LKNRREDLAAKLEGKTVNLSQKRERTASFSALSQPRNFRRAEKQFGAEIDKRKISLESDIKAFGSYTAVVKLHPGISASVYVWLGKLNKNS
jgi:large subunit ribosomal protein L9